jgi:pyrimidine operon attenuation protein/uracil phosphoribosyltransferase
MQVLLSTPQLNESITNLARTLSNVHKDHKDVVYVGIQQGGAVLGARIVEELEKMNGVKIDYGQLDITFYRDDFRKEIFSPDPMNLPFDIDGKTVVLIDDVLFTGRTIKAALDVLLDYGRPAKVELLVLIDRKEHRQFPIQADYVGKTVNSRAEEKIKLVNGEVILNQP